MSNGFYSLRDLALYAIKELGGQVEGLKKLMKLIFLIQYEKPRFHNYVRKYLFKGKPISGTEFYIWDFGPMSDDVYDIIEKENSIETYVDEYGRVILKLSNTSINIDLPDIVRSRIDKVIEEHGDKSGSELERYILRHILKMDEIEKREYLGIIVDNYFKIKGVNIKFVELSS